MTHENTKPTARACSRCETPIGEFDGTYEDADGDDLCCDCWHDDAIECPVCCEWFIEANAGPDVFIVFDAESAGVRRGLYRATRRQFYTQSIIGSGWLHKDAIERIGNIPSKVAVTRDRYPCETLCPACASSQISLINST